MSFPLCEMFPYLVLQTGYGSQLFVHSQRKSGITQAVSWINIIFI